MASAQFDTGLTGSVVGNLFGSGAGTSAASPPRTFMPEGPATVTAAAYGSDGGSYSGNCGTHALIAGIIGLAVLIGFWVTLPR